MPARLPVLEVAAPCPVRWEDMTGDDRIRFCRQCRQDVYNVESLTAAEVQALIRRREGGRVCVRLKHRSDGTVITRDCWHAFRRARERLLGTAMGVAVAAMGVSRAVGVLAGWLRRAAPACPPPLDPRASLPELPEPPTREFVEKQLEDEVKRSRPKRPGWVRVNPPQPSITMGVVLMDD